MGKAAPSPELRAKITKMPAGQVIASVIPRGPKLDLIPVMDRIACTSPDESTQNTIGGVIIPEGVKVDHQAYACVKVLAVGPDVRSVKAGNTILVVRGQVAGVNHDGNAYWWTTEANVMGIVLGE